MCTRQWFSCILCLVRERLQIDLELWFNKSCLPPLQVEEAQGALGEGEAAVEQSVLRQVRGHLRYIVFRCSLHLRQSSPPAARMITEVFSATAAWISVKMMLDMPMTGRSNRRKRGERSKPTVEA